MHPPTLCPWIGKGPRVAAAPSRGGWQHNSLLLLLLHISCALFMPAVGLGGGGCGGPSETLGHFVGCTGVFTSSAYFCSTHPPLLLLLLLHRPDTIPPPRPPSYSTMDGAWGAHSSSGAPGLWKEHIGTSQPRLPFSSLQWYCGGLCFCCASPSFLIHPLLHWGYRAHAGTSPPALLVRLCVQWSWAGPSPQGD